MNIQNQVVILSASKKELSKEENEQRSTRLLNMIKDVKITVNQATGFYKGAHETSLVCVVNNDTQVDTLKGFAFKQFDQESILYQDANGLTTLVFKDGATDRLERLRRVDSVEGLNNYTELNGAYYACVKE